MRETFDKELAALAEAFRLMRLLEDGVYLTPERARRQAVRLLEKVGQARRVQKQGRIHWSANSGPVRS